MTGQVSQTSYSHCLVQAAINTTTDGLPVKPVSSKGSFGMVFNISVYANGRADSIDFKVRSGSPEASDIKNITTRDGS
jgi:hypothetical protein